MTYRPTMFEVANGDAIALDISLDPESKIGHTLFFKIEQDGHEIVVSLETLENLHEAAKELLRGYRDTCPPCNNDCNQGRDCPARK